MSSDYKRGEVNELRGALRDAKLMRNPVKRKEVIKKVIGCMTQGIDMSKLFSEMTMIAESADPVIKKMVYLYLCTYAEQEPGLALLAINTLQKNCRHVDPMTRGLALRSLCSLRLPNIVEYMLTPVRQGLTDKTGYVRKTAVNGVTRVFRLNRELVVGSDLVDVLYSMLRDAKPQVITNAICALNEILATEGGIVINTKIVFYLLNRMKEFSEWGQCIILDILAKFETESEQQIFDIMNLLNDRLQHGNSAVVMAASKIYLQYGEKMPQLLESIVQRLKTPFLTLMGAGGPELTYVMLSHVRHLVLTCPSVFQHDDSFKQFFCRDNDSDAVKLLKLSILVLVSSEHNLTDLLSELSEYVSSATNADIARQTIKCMGKIGLRVAQGADDVIEYLLGFLQYDREYITSVTLVVLKDILRKYPDSHEDVITGIKDVLNDIDVDSNGRAAALWMIGEYGHAINDAPYILENEIETFQEEPSTLVRKELLTATMKLFFKRPPELQKMLGKLLQKAIEDTSRVDVHDRAVLYYRLLQADVFETSRVVHGEKSSILAFSEDTDDSQLIHSRFNTLSLIYLKDPAMFLRALDEDFGDSDDEDEGKEQDGNETQLMGGEQKQQVDQQQPQQEEQQQQQPVVEDIFGFGDFGMSDASSSSSSSSSFPQQQQQPLQFDSSVVLQPPEYEAKWKSFTPLDPLAFSSTEASDMANALTRGGLTVLVQGQFGDQIKLYVYASAQASQSLFLMETTVHPGSGFTQCAIRAAPEVPQEELKQFIDVVYKATSAILD